MAAEKPFAWPNGAKAAVNLAYDDALALYRRAAALPNIAIVRAVSSVVRTSG